MHKAGSGVGHLNFDFPFAAANSSSCGREHGYSRASAEGYFHARVVSFSPLYSFPFAAFRNSDAYSEAVRAVETAPRAAPEWLTWELWQCG